MYIARLSSILLLTFIGLSACLGGAVLLIDPSGRLLQLNVAGLADTIFLDYRGPGFILFFTIGLLNLVAAGFVINKANIYPTLIFLQGAILVGWIMAEVYLLPQTHYLQLIYAIFGLMLMLLGSLLHTRRIL